MAWEADTADIDTAILNTYVGEWLEDDGYSHWKSVTLNGLGSAGLKTVFRRPLPNHNHLLHEEISEEIPGADKVGKLSQITMLWMRNYFRMCSFAIMHLSPW